MKKFLIFILSLSIFWGSTSLQSLVSADSGSIEAEFLDVSDSDRIIVTIKSEYSGFNKQFSQNDFPGVDIAEIEYLTSLRENPDDYIYLNQENYQQILLIKLNDETKSNIIENLEILNSLQIVKNADIDRCNLTFSAEPDDTLFYYQPSLDLIDAPSAWDLTTGSSVVKVGIVDSGIANHIDLADNVVSGWDFVNNNNITNDDIVGHGTHIAGIIGATTDNDEGIAGVAWDVSLVPLQVTDALGGISDSSIVSAIDYAVTHNIPILNISLYTNIYSENLYNAISTYSGLVCCCAGNEGAGNDLGSNNDLSPKYPASYNLDNIISVANSDNDDLLDESSNYGALSVDLAAPGCGIDSADITGNTYDGKSGTSMSTAFVSGVAALLLSYNDNLNARQLKTAILDSVDKIDALSGKVLTGGRLNAYNALTYVFEGDKVRNYKVNVNISGFTDIGYASLIVNYSEGVVNYNNYVDGTIIPSGEEGSVMNVIEDETEYMYYNYDNSITSTGVLLTLKYDAPFVNKDCRSTFTVGSSFFRNSSGGVITPTVTLSKILMGDANSDGVVNSSDATRALQAATGSVSLTSTQKLAVDIDCNGVISTNEALTINQYVSGTRLTLW